MLLRVISELQGLVGRASSYHANDRDRNGHEKGQACLHTAHELCIEASSFDDQVDGLNIKIHATGLTD